MPAESADIVEGFRIVHVDDDANDREAVLEALKSPGVIVESLTGIRQFSAEKSGAVGLFIFDMRFNGRQMIQRLMSQAKVRDPEASIVVLTHYANDPELNELIFSAQVEALDKSNYLFDSQRLRERLRMVLEKQSKELPPLALRGWTLRDISDRLADTKPSVNLDIVASWVGYITEIDGDDEVIVDAWDENEPDPDQKRLIFPRRMFSNVEPFEVGTPVRYVLCWQGACMISAIEAANGESWLLPMDLSASDAELMERVIQRNRDRESFRDG